MYAGSAVISALRTRPGIVAAVLLWTALFATLSPASADLVDSTVGQGIGTSVDDVFGDGTNVAIRTSITSVKYGFPRVVFRDGLLYLELLGSVQGTGWGGEQDTLGGPGPTVSAETHYTYDVPFVLRWHPAFDGTLVYYAHGYQNPMKALDARRLYDRHIGERVVFTEEIRGLFGH